MLDPVRNYLNDRIIFEHAHVDSLLSIVETTIMGLLDFFSD